MRKPLSDHRTHFRQGANFVPVRFVLRVVILLFLLATADVVLGYDDPRQLLPNSREQQVINGGETRTYQLGLQKGQYARLAFDRSTAQIEVLVIAPDGRQAARLDCNRCETSPLSLIADKTGTYLVKLRSKDAAGIAGQFDLRVAEIRPSSTLDSIRLIAEDNLAKGKALRDQWQTGATRQAIVKFQTAGLNFRRAGDVSGQELARLETGDAHRSLGSLQEAQTAYEKVLAMVESDARLRARAALGISGIGYLQGNKQKAMESGLEALRLCREVGDGPGEVRALIGVGDAYQAAGDQTKALASYEEALRAAEKAEDRAGKALALLYIGYTMSDLGDRLKARDYFIEALAQSRALGDLRVQVKVLSVLGTTCSNIGELQQALAFYNQAAQILQGHNEPMSEAAIYNGRALVYEALGDPESTLEDWLRALKLWKVANYRRGAIQLQTYLARLYLKQGDTQKALNSILDATRLSQGIEDVCHHALLASFLGHIFTKMGRQAEALSAYEKALAATRTCANPWTEAQAVNGLGDVYRQRGDHAKAIRQYEEVLAINRKLHDAPGEVTTLCRIAQTFCEAGDFESANGRLGEAVKKIESLRQKVADDNLRAAYFATVRETYELTIDVLTQLDKRNPNRDYLATAFEVSERARARSLLDTLADAKVDVREEADPALIEQERSLRSKIADAEQKLAQLYSKASAQEQVTNAERELKQLLNLLDEVQAQIRVTSPHYASLVYPEPLSLTEAQKLLDDQTILLEYAVGETHSHLWVVSSSELRHFELPGRPALDAAARRFYDLMTAMAPTPALEQEATRLGRLLLGPATEQLPGKRLIIIPDGALFYVPFAVLPGEQDGKLAGSYSPLIARHEITYLPSASALSLLRQAAAKRTPAPQTLALFADPVFSKSDLEGRNFSSPTASVRAARSLQKLRAALRQAGVKDAGLSRLPSTQIEAQAIIDAAGNSEIFRAIGLDANLETLNRIDLSQYRIIHFATHGLIDGVSPAMSSLVLSLVNSRGESRNGFLRLHDIYNLKLRADLVVLSACDTALGKEIRGEGFASLTRGFMHAGSSRVMASLWKIDDAATAELMKRFYAKMLREGKRPSTALREAQEEIRQQRRWQSPFYWGAFILQGEPD